MMWVASSINLGFLTQLTVTVSGHLFVCVVTLLKFFYVFCDEHCGDDWGSS